ncbi:MAG: protein kinase [Verrucomicrobiae bacterium]|nr:protein kinase [Verrucomicrobiae bacterium]
MSDRYQIKAKIGEGGTGAVWVALDRETKRDVALKRLKARDAVDASGKKQDTDDLIREGRALSSLQHPNIVTLLDVGSDEDGVFLVMELLRGKTLDAAVEKDGPLSVEDFEELAKQTLAGLIAAQDRGLVHRDLKPGNIMIHRPPGGNLQCKILDFGLAKFSSGASLQTEDQESGIYGSVHFMAPEQFERKPLDGRTDLYALGCIFYFALTGCYPFAGDTNAEVMASHLQHSVTRIREVRPDIPEWLGDWVMWFLNRQAQHRPASAQVGLSHFLECAADEADANAVPPPPPPVPVTEAPLAPPPPPPPAPIAEPVVHHRRHGRTKSPMALLAILMLSATVVGLGIWGYAIYSKQRAENREIEIFNKLTLPGNDHPVGDAEAVAIIAKMMQTRGGNTAEHGVACLEKLTGPGVENAIVAQIGETQADTRVKFIEVAVARKLKGTAGQLVSAAKSSVTKVREAALTGLAEIAAPDDLDALIGMIGDNAGAARNRQLLTEAIYSASSRAEGSQGSVRLIAALSKITGGNERGFLLKVLGRLGGDEALSTLEKELRSDDKNAQRSAVLGLSAWPNGKAAAPLSNYVLRTQPGDLRDAALLGWVQVIGRSGDIPGEEKVKQLMEAAKLITGSSVKKALFQQLSKIPDEAALQFLEELYTKGDEANDAEAARYAEQAERQLSDLLPRVIDITEEEVLLDAEKALIAGQGPFFNRIENTVQNWNNPAAWVLWHVRIAEPGPYLLDVIQAQDLDVKNTFEVTFGGSVLLCDVKKTPSREEFENVEAGIVDITQPGLYEIIIKPKKIEGESLMVLRGISLLRNP